MRKILVMLMAAIICICGSLTDVEEVKAESLGEDMDYSFLLTDNALVSYINMQTRGVYLLNGSSAINKISTSKIGAGGVTTAAKSCKVSITSTVERQTTTGWAYVT